MRTVANADMIVVLDGEKVAEQGTPEEVLRNQGVFSRLYAAQGL